MYYNYSDNINPQPSNYDPSSAGCRLNNSGNDRNRCWCDPCNPCPPPGCCPQAGPTGPTGALYLGKVTVCKNAVSIKPPRYGY